MMNWLAKLAFFSPPLIVSILFVVCLFIGEPFFIFFSIYAGVVFAFFFLTVYVFRVIELGLCICMMLIHLPSSLFLAGRFQREGEGQADLWFYHLVCQTINCGALLLVRML
jgi:hypothetical protein